MQDPTQTTQDPQQQQQTPAEPAAPAPQQTQASQAPVDPAQRYEQLYSPPAPAVDVAAMREQLRQELLAELKPPTPAPAQAEIDWLDALQKGDRAVGEAALAKLVGGKLNLQEVQQGAVQEALQRFMMHQQITDHVASIKADPQNADVLRLEPYITAAVEQRLTGEQARIKSPADYVKVYKEIITDELSKARQLVLSFRGEGATQAATRQRTVLANPMLTPQAVTDTRQPQTTQAVEPETAAEYFAKRQQQQLRLRGMQA